MDLPGAFIELYGRIPPLAAEAVADLDVTALTTQVAPDANTIAWLVWHTARVQDQEGAELAGTTALWVQDPRWSESFRLAPDPDNTGYGHRPEEAAAICPVEPAALMAYLDAVHARNAPILASLSAVELDRIVDDRWDPPVTLGVRLVSIADDGLQHMGQAAYVRGIVTR
jgi:hypothetical protein